MAVLTKWKACLFSAWVKESQYWGSLQKYFDEEAGHVGHVQPRRSLSSGSVETVRSSVFGLKCWDKLELPEDIQGQEAGRLQAAHHCSAPRPSDPAVQTSSKQLNYLFQKTRSVMDTWWASLLMAGAGEEYEDYQYPDWGVDRVDLDFKSGWICVKLCLSPENVI